MRRYRTSSAPRLAAGVSKRARDGFGGLAGAGSGVASGVSAVGATATAVIGITSAGDDRRTVATVLVGVARRVAGLVAFASVFFLFLGFAVIVVSWWAHVVVSGLA